jgi:hypothetical protein
MKKFVTFVLILSLGLFSIAGCGGSKPPKKTPEKKTSEKETLPAPTEEKKEGGEAKAADEKPADTPAKTPEEKPEAK